MTNEQAANRQADHENLVRELISALNWAESRLYELEPEGRTWVKCCAALSKAREQGYA